MAPPPHGQVHDGVYMQVPHGQHFIQPAPLDPNMAAHIDSMDRSTELTHRLLERLSAECSHSVRKDELHDVIQGIQSMQVGQRRGPNVSLPHFTGDAASSFEQWGRDLEEKFEYLQWGIDHPNRVRIMPTLLEGLAKIKYRELPQGIQHDYHRLMAELSTLFGLPSKNAIFIYNQLERPQKQNESVHDYSRDILQRMHNNNITDERYMLACYLKNLKSQIRSKVLLMSPQTLAQAEQCAETVEQSLAIDNSEEKLEVAINELQRQNGLTCSALNALHSKSVSFVGRDFRDDDRSRRYDGSTSRDRYGRDRRDSDQGEWGSGQYRRERGNRDGSYRDYNYAYRSPPRNRSNDRGYSRQYQNDGRGRSNDRSRDGRNQSQDRFDRSFDGRDRRNGFGRSDRSRDRYVKPGNSYREPGGRFDRSRDRYSRSSDRYDASRDRYDRSRERYGAPRGDNDRNKPYRHRAPTPHNSQVENVGCQGACVANCQSCSVSVVAMNPDMKYCASCKEHHEPGRHTQTICHICFQAGHASEFCPGSNLN